MKKKQTFSLGRIVRVRMARLLTFFKTPLSLQPQQRRKKWLLVIRGLFSAGLLWVLISRLDWKHLFLLFFQIHWPWLFAALGGTVLSLTFSVLRWKIILKDLNLKIEEKTVWQLVLSGFFFNQFLPSTVGGDSYRFLRLLRYFPRRQKEILTSLLLDRGYGFLALLGVHAIIVPFVFSIIVRYPILSTIEAGIGIGVFVVGSGVVLSKRIHLQSFGERKIPAIMKPWLESFLDFLETLLRRSRRTVMLSLAYSAAFVVVNGLTLGTYLRLVGLNPPWIMGIYASSLAAIAGAVPISVNGLGLMEGVMVLSLEPLGWPREGVLLAAFWLRTINLLEAALGGVLYFLEVWKQKQ